MIKTSRTSIRNSSSLFSFVNSDYRKGYVMENIPYQRAGILSRLLWNSKDSIIRIVPGYDENGVFPQNINVNEFSNDSQDYTEYLSDSFLMASIMDGFGESHQMFISSYRPGSPEDTKYGGDTVVDVFARNIKRSVDSASKGKRSKFAVTDQMRKWVALGGTLRYSSRALLMQALIFKSNGKFNQDENDQPLIDPEDGSTLPLYGVVGVTGTQTINALVDALVSPADPGMPLNPATNNKYGALAELEGNLLYLNHATGTVNGKPCAMLKPSVQEAGKQGWTKEPFYLDEGTVHSLWIPWDKLINYMTPAEQARLIAAEFGADSVNYFVGTDPIYRDFEFPEEIAAAGYGRYAKYVNGEATAQSEGTRPSTGTGMGLGAPKLSMKRPQLNIQTPEQALGTPVQHTPKTPVVPASQAPIPGPRPGLRPMGPKGPAAPPRQDIPTQGLNGLRANSTTDMSKLTQTLGRIHQATNQTEESVDVANAIVNDPDLNEYLGDIPGEENQ